MQGPPGPEHEPPLLPLLVPLLPLLVPLVPLLPLPGHAVARDLHAEVFDCVKHLSREAWSGQSK